jgi:hypothetical protein
MKFNVGNSLMQNLNAFLQFTYARIAIKTKKAAHLLRSVAMVNRGGVPASREVYPADGAPILLRFHHCKICFSGNAKLCASLTKFPFSYFIRMRMIPVFNSQRMVNAMFCVKAIAVFFGFWAAVVSFCAGFAIGAKTIRLGFISVKLATGFSGIARSTMLGDTKVGHSLILQNAFRLWLGRIKSYLVRPFELYHCHPSNSYSFCACVDAAPPHIFSEAASSIRRLHVSCT